jgi:trehalose/maltose hydrolase-like predicted phosphorylase
MRSIPGSDEEGLRNNAYTNVMVAWISDTAQKVLELLPERRRRSLCARLGLSDEEIETWREMSRKMFVPFHGEGVISQFEGYEELEELDWDHYREKYGNIQRLDRILKAEGDDPDKYKLTKQADAVLLFFLFPEDELKRIFERLDYEYEPEMVRKTVEYYDHRTSHGSTLSFVAHAGILAGLDPESSWERYMVALESDVGDVQGGTTKEGIHMGVMAGTLDLIQRGYLGTVIRDGTLHFDPKPVGNLDGLSFPMRFRGMPLEVTLEGDKLTVTAQSDGFSQPIRVGVGDTVREVKAGESFAFGI